ncbi:hypothetical protein E2C01_075610 [Portunus trituberculatus]|uniref:Uncharacterized protein n=1 Tax=Portunus trituberculatus TaxID=210409 RepID=A0A5B7I912_PORTR|nr:hypothetical protein [Portunus trituberculatus]
MTLVFQAVSERDQGRRHVGMAQAARPPSAKAKVEHRPACPAFVNKARTVVDSRTATNMTPEQIVATAHVSTYAPDYFTA